MITSRTPCSCQLTERVASQTMTPQPRITSPHSPFEQWSSFIACRLSPTLPAVLVVFPRVQPVHRTVRCCDQDRLAPIPDLHVGICRSNADGLAQPGIDGQ